MKKLILVIVALSLLFSAIIRVRLSYSSGTALGDIIGSISISPIDLTATHFAIIFSQINLSNYDSLVQIAVNQQDWKNVFYIERMAEIDGYSSNALDSAVKQALYGMPMTGHLPLTWTDTNHNDYFGTNYRVVLNGYRYASKYGVETSGWNKSQAYSELLQSYVDNGQPSIGYRVGGKDFDYQQCRYYDEAAQTADALFKLGGSYSDLWDYAQKYWYESSSMYSYVQATSVFECEVGGFAMIWGCINVQCSVGSNFSRISEDLYTKMLASGWNSRAWRYMPGVMSHSDDSPTLRLENTLMGIQALHTYYCQSSWKQNFIDMLSGNWDNKPAWKALTDSPLYQDGKFGFRDLRYTPSSPSATGCGAMLLFLEGIIPDTGSLAMPLNEECCEDIAYGYPSTQFKFDYANRKIMIPIHAGKIKFQYGTQLTSCYFPNDGIYEVCFSNDWNRVVGATKVGNLEGFQYLTYLKGDVNHDGIVNRLDLVTVAKAFGSMPGYPNWNQAADLNKEGVINILDISLVAKDYGKTV